MMPAFRDSTAVREETHPHVVNFGRILKIRESTEISRWLHEEESATGTYARACLPKKPEYRGKSVFFFSDLNTAILFKLRWL